MILPLHDACGLCMNFVTLKALRIIMYACVYIQIRRSQHAFINPAITIILRMGAGGLGVPPLGTPDG